jgi:hypothetical protein
MDVTNVDTFIAHDIEQEVAQGRLQYPLVDGISKTPSNAVLVQGQE